MPEIRAGQPIMEAYLDYNATTPVDPRVFEAMRPFFEAQFANASSVHRRGQAARSAIESSREKIAATLEVEPGDLIFTSGGTEADNLALEGVMAAIGQKRPHLVVSQVEHQAVLHTARHLEKRGFRVSYIPVDHRGQIDLDLLKLEVTSETALVSVMHANNEVGTIQPIEEIAKIAHSQGALFHTDAVQSFGKLELLPEKIGADLVSLSAHKICGPKGAGALYIRKGVKVLSLMHGGHQEKNIRPGTENVAALAGFGRAAEIARAERSSEAVRVQALRDRLYKRLEAVAGPLKQNGDLKHRLAGTLNLSFEGFDGETLLVNLDLVGVFVSTGSACTAGSIEPSHVLLAMGLSEAQARSSARFSLGRFTTDAEVEYAAQQIPPIVDRLRRGATSRRGKDHPKTP